MKQEDSERILCLCLNITTRDIRRAVGAGARTFSEVQRITRCAKSCGMCAGAVKEELVRLLAEQ